MPSNESRIYVGNLPPDIRTKDIEDLFYKYGKIVFIDMKNRRGPPFAFVGKKKFQTVSISMDSIDRFNIEMLWILLIYSVHIFG